ncbi:hypothetical protein DFJ73DRAFT_799811 [Zopfochytrium polystomum]|nr:hypothetical protein DFJ73DRAFT_799811 [Zopfochytrium polystomum]
MMISASWSAVAATAAAVATAASASFANGAPRRNFGSGGDGGGGDGGASFNPLTDAGTGGWAAAATTVPSDPLAQQATQVLTATATGFGTFIEGAATDVMGNLYAVNFGANSDLATVGYVCGVGGAFGLFYGQRPPLDSSFNGMRFAEGGRVAYVADTGAKRLIKVDVPATALAVAAGPGGPAPPVPQVVCANPGFLKGVPNDLAITTAGNHIYLSGQNYTANTTSTDGEVWLCDTTTNTTMRLAQMGRTNGIELSPDNAVLYVSEAFNVNFAVVSNVIWKFDRDAATGMISNKRLFADFGAVANDSAAVDVDGMRTDAAGNLYVTRNGGGSVAKLDAATGTLVGRIATPGTRFPANLEFGGPLGTTLFVVGRCGSAAFGTGAGCVDKAETDTPGRAIVELRRAAAAAAGVLN